MKKILDLFSNTWAVDFLKICFGTMRSTIATVVIAGLGVFGWVRTTDSNNKKADCSKEEQAAKDWQNMYNEKDKQYQDVIIAVFNMKEMMATQPKVIPTSYMESGRNNMMFASYRMPIDTTKKPLTKEQRIMAYADSVLKANRIKDSLLKVKQQSIPKN